MKDTEEPRLWGCYCYDMAGTVRKHCPKQSEACRNGKQVLEERLAASAKQRALDYEKTKRLVLMDRFRHRMAAENPEYAAELLDLAKRHNARRIG